MNKDLDLGKRKNYQNVYAEMYTGLKYFALNLLKSEDIAEDIIQDVWLKIWHKKPSFENKHKLKAYLYQSVRNAALNHIRQSNTKNKVFDQIQIEGIELDISEKIIESEIYSIINQTFNQLPPSAKRVYLEKLNGKKHKEIAEELNISINTVKKHINNSNHFLRENLKHLLDFAIFILLTRI